MSTMNVLSITLVALILGAVVALVMGVQAASAHTTAIPTNPPVTTAAPSITL